VISRAECSELPVAALDRALTDVLRVRGSQAAAAFRVLEVRPGPETLADCPARAVAKHVSELVPPHPNEAARSDSSRNARRQRIDEPRQVRLDLVPREARPHETHATIDVEADSTRRDHAASRIHGCDATDGEAVTPVGVGHAEARLDDPRQRGDVRGLDEHVVVHRVRELLRREDANRNPHARPEAGSQLEYARADLA
jgi:hypothetical protein